MAQHGYLREYDEAFDRSEERDRWRDEDRDRAFMFTGRGEREPASRRFRSGQDDHYLSWRDKQMEALDRDYADYCREREQQFHQDFDSWRRQRANRQPLQTGMTQTGAEPVMELNEPLDQSKQGTTSAMGEATLGTTSSEETSTSRGRS